jgi:hypothetical protein
LFLNLQFRKEQLYAQWKTVIVQEYTGKKLTYGTDRLPALSGLAKVFMRNLKDTYFAGLWHGDMHRGLLWYGTGDFKVSPTYRAPTWSWASVDGPITHPSFGGPDVVWHAAAQIKEVITTPYIDDVTATGQLTGGHLRLSGTLIKINVNIPSLPDKIVRTLSLRGKLETPLGNLNPDSMEVVFYPVAQRPGDVNISPSAGDLKQAEEIFFLPLMYWKDGHPDSWTALGLALSPEDGVTGTYRKIGIVQTYKEIVLRALVKNCRPKDPCYYENYDGNIDYIIKII